jgi:hypothetical protein
MRNALRIAILIAAATLTAAAAAGTSAAGAHAAVTARPSPHHLGLAPVLPITLTPAGFTIPGDNPRPAGLVTFSVSAPGPASYYWTSFKLENGVTLQQVAQWLSQAESPDQTVALAAVRDLYSNVDFTGGLAVNGNSTLGLTVKLTPGTYYFTAAPAEPTSGASISRNSARSKFAAMARALATPAPSPLQILQVTDTVSPALPPPYSGTLVLREVHGQARYFRTGHFRGQGAFLLRNDTTQPQEANFEQVVPGTTDKQIQNYFNAVLAGTTPPPSPFLAVVGGELLLSPGHTVIVQTTFTPGWYSALSFPTDENTGVKQAYNGTHIVLTMQ